MEILQFIFRDFWTWLGSILILGVIFGAISQFRFFEVHKSEPQTKPNNMEEE